jgi:hypothetical protein
MRATSSGSPAIRRWLQPAAGADFGKATFRERQIRMIGREEATIHISSVLV